jgi:membrane-associated PAP2 superfamily phosphatase
MARAGLCLALIVGVVAGLVFAIDPSLDLRISAFFFGPGAQSLTSSEDVVINAVRIFNLVLVIVVVGLAGAALIVRMSSGTAPMLVPARAACLVLLVYLAGPVLMANAIFKENWSRPRPGHVVEFGGTHTFKPWWDPRGTCPQNCSFVSGEASSAFAVLALAVIAPIGWRFRAVGAALLYGVLVSGIRVMVGGHFTSDVIFAGVFTALVVWAAHGLIYRWPTRVDEQTAEKRVAAFAAQLRSRIVTPLYGLFVRPSGARSRSPMPQGTVQLDTRQS